MSGADADCEIPRSATDSPRYIPRSERRRHDPNITASNLGATRSTLTTSDATSVANGSGNDLIADRTSRANRVALMRNWTGRLGMGQGSLTGRTAGGVSSMRVSIGHEPRTFRVMLASRMA